ncbi:hypothetical protein ABIA39_006587 [Nocardia sp. GAS34]
MPGALSAPDRIQRTATPALFTAHLWACAPTTVYPLRHQHAYG